MQVITFGPQTFRITEAQAMEWREAENLKLLDRIIRQRELLADWELVPAPAWMHSLKETVRRGRDARS